MTVHSKDGKTWLTKLNRIGELSANDKHMIFNNIGHLLNKEMLKEQFHQLKGNKAVGIDSVTKDRYRCHLDKNISNLIYRIRRGTYRPKPARIIQIAKEDGSTRPLAISCLEDKLVTAPTIEGKQTSINMRGCPQGSIISPILANVYLHYVVDVWFNKIKQTHLHGRAEQIRYADDMVFTLERKSAAERFYKVLPKRLAKFGLELHEEKSQIISVGHVAVLRAKHEGKRLSTFKFLGFTCYWGQSRKGFWRLKYTSRKDRFASKLSGMKKFLRRNINKHTRTVLRTVIRVVIGWVNYHGISDNHRRVKQFLRCSKRILFKWVNRRGGKKRIPWVRFAKVLKAIQFPDKWKTVSMF